MSDVLAIKSDIERKSEWDDAFAGFDIEVRHWDTMGNPADIDYALVWQPEPGSLATMPNLKLVFSVGAGIDHLKGNNIVPAGIPIIRMVEDVLTAGMTEFVLYHVLRYHRFMPQYEQDRRNRIWSEIPAVPAQHRPVGILGLGVLGGAAATALVSLGFKVAGWSRTEKQIEGVASYYGDQQLAEFLAGTEILVCLLPLTPQTENIINANTLAMLPEGAHFINAGRGGHCNEQDLLAALDSGQLAGAALDVFKSEPLEYNSPIWGHPLIYFTPHIASMTLPASSARHVIDNIIRFRTDQPLTHAADLQQGY